MFIKKVSFNRYKILENIEISFNKKENHLIYPIISSNGGGKSTLLQVMFSFLHFPFRAERHKYLLNLLEYYDCLDSNELEKIIKFELDIDGKDVNLEFYCCKNNYKNLDFYPIKDLKYIEQKLESKKKIITEIKVLENIYDTFETLEVSEILSSSIWKELKDIVGEKKYSKISNNKKRNILSEFIKNTIKNKKLYILKLKSLENELLSIKDKEVILKEVLDKENVSYLFHFNKDKNIFLYRSNISFNELSDISNKVYLATPKTQILHFLDSKELETIFFKSHYSSYYRIIERYKRDIKGLFSYEFAVVNLIIEAFEKARDKDFKEVINTGKYGNEVKNTLRELNKLLFDKSFIIDDNLTKVIFRSKKSGIILKPENLSHGELKRLSIYVWLKTKIENGSIVFMDEVGIGLHPTWQYELYDDLQKWNKDSQFIIATHSPQIISKSYYKNLIIMKQNQNGSSTSEKFKETPLESDLNTVVKTIMGGEYLPEKLLKLRKQYRILFNEGKIDTEEAKKIKNDILMYETENSSFFQELKFKMLLKK